MSRACGFAHLIRCKACDRINYEANHDAKFENSFVRTCVCDACGSTEGFYDSVEQWFSTSKLFNPFTWGDGYWVKKEMSHD